VTSQNPFSISEPPAILSGLHFPEPFAGGETGLALARFLELRGHRVFEALGTAWAHYRGSFFCALPYQRELDPDPAEVREMMRKHRVWCLRYRSRDRTEFPSGLYVCRPREYGMERLSRQCRQHVSRGLNLCTIREVEPAELLVEGRQLNLETMERQHRYDPEFGDPAQWKRFVQAVRQSPGVSVTGAYLSGRLSAYIVTCREGAWLHMLYKMTRTLDRSYPVSHALDYWLITQAAADPGIEFAENSFVSVLPNDGLDAYKRHMGFFILPFDLAVRFHPLLSPLIANRVAVAAAKAAWRMRPKEPRLELAAKILEGARTTMTNQFPIAEPADPCQHTDCRSYSRLWRPYPLFLLREAMAHLKRAGPKQTARKALDFALRRLGLKPKPAAGPRVSAADEVLSLQPGDWVEVRSEPEIRATLDGNGKHRGMAFVPIEMLVHSGRRYRVLKRVEKIFLEESRQNRKLKNTVLLDGVHCQGIGLDCDRSCYLFWREAWLKKIDQPK
jgi:hypothetical protein